MPWKELISSLSSNPYFSAGFGLIGVGAGAAILRNSLRYSLDHARRRLFISVEIPSKDKSYSWLMEWLSNREGYRTQHTSIETSFVQYENGEISSRVQFLPSPGTHFFKYKSTWIKVERSREKNVVDINSGSLWETLTLTTLGQSRKIFEEIITEARILALQKEEGTTVIYTTSGIDWRRFGFPRKRRPLNSVILEEGKGERILSDVKEFLASMRWYSERGIPYRRGYLLYGPPGSGKSSFIAALAGELRLNICILNLNSRGLNDETLNLLLNTAPQRSIILLEDIDAVVTASASLSTTIPNITKGTMSSNQSFVNSVTFSGLLNALDGVAATEGGGRILFMTTNHIEKLPEALVRPGRVDIKEMIDTPTPPQIKLMFLRFFPEREDLAVEFVHQVTKVNTAHDSARLSMAQLQGYLLTLKDDPQGALQNVEHLFQQHFSLSYKSL
jgi:chaperone BCS1